MNFIDNLKVYKVVDVIESAINAMDLTGTEYEKRPFTYIHGNPIDVKNEHENYKSGKLPVIFLFEPLELSTNLDEMLNWYKSGRIRLFIMDRLDKFGKAKQTQRSYDNVLNHLDVIVNRFITSMNDQIEVMDIYNVESDVDYTDWAVDVEQKIGGNTTSSFSYKNLTGKEILFDLKTHRLNNC